jgi:hypothetical protein
VTGRTNSADAVLKPSGLGRSRFAPSAKSMRHREVMALWCVRVCGFVRGEEATCTARVLTHLEQLSHPTQSRPTLRPAGSLQGVPPSCCGRRVAVWQHRNTAHRPGGSDVCGHLPRAHGTGDVRASSNTAHNNTTRPQPPPTSEGGRRFADERAQHRACQRAGCPFLRIGATAVARVHPPGATWSYTA